MIAFVDFETRSELDVSNVGAERYALHPSTEVMCLAYARETGLAELWHPGLPIPDLFRLEPDRLELHAHNAAFERAVWREVMHKRLGWPAIDDRQWHCTAAQAAALALPRKLELLAKALDLPVLKDVFGHKVMKKLTKLREAPKKGRSLWNHQPDDLDVLYEYCKTDVVVERMAWRMMPPLPKAERQLYILDQRINDRGIPIDRELCEAAVELDRQQTEALTAELADLTQGQITTGGQTARILEWLDLHGTPLPDLTKQTVDDALANGAEGPVRRVLEIRQSLARASTAKFQAMLDRCGPDNRVRGAHLYHGATTGRWAGKGIQPQNIPRGSLSADQYDTAIEAVRTRSPELVRLLFGDPADTLSSLIRPAIRAEPGKRFIVCDFAGIEARVLAWLAGEEDLLTTFFHGGDVYKTMAAAIYKVPLAEVTKAQRQIGKIAILGLGYGMGAETFQSTCAGYGVTIDLDFAQTVVDTYRQRHNRIQVFWYALNDAAIRAVEADKSQHAGTIVYQRRDKWLFCRLPSGREIAYFKPSVTQQKTTNRQGVTRLKPTLQFWGTTANHQWGTQRTYPGKLTENVVQAVARDFLSEALFRIEAAGYPVVMHVHDEVVVETDRATVPEIESLMKELPSWGTGCPIDAEGFETVRYRK